MASSEKRENLERLQSLAEDDDFDAGPLQDAPDIIRMDDILDGSARINISHAGGEFNTLRQDIAEDAGEEPEMPMRAQGEESEVQAMEDEIWELDVVDMFETTTVPVKLNLTGNGITPASILEGLMPCAPTRPSVAIKIQVLEAYRVTHVRCPQLAIQLWVKALCNIHGQFSIAYDLYLDLRRRVDERVMKALRRDSKWRMKHACPACMYKLDGEEKLIFDLLTTMDGNDSLKRVLQREKGEMEVNKSGEPTLGESRERVDNRDASNGYIISREKVDRWAKSCLANILPMQGGNLDEENPCADRWKNMVNDVTSKMWGIFDETGIFLALCRHGFVLVLADMIKSGELAKYPLAVVKELLDTFGMDIGAGYNVGCHFCATVAHSELGDVAKEKNLRCLVGSFHGHAHNHLCQLSFLATYVEGMGLEDLEGCERYFSRSNGLAKSCCYASRFHRQQEITTYAKHFDSFETYANLGKFLCNNYRQALAILRTEPALNVWMRQEGVSSPDEFHTWLREEKAYLLSLKNEPKTNTETLEMEYVQKLVNLSASEAKYQVVAAEAKKASKDDAVYVPGVPKTEVARRHAKERMTKDLDAVQDLEDILDIWECWTTASPRWIATVEAIKTRKYQTALDALELLIVERIFELTKMNESQTEIGYKMCKHIAKALQARSKAVKNAIERYNAAASVLRPLMPQLTWEQVVEYAFLADFDILQDTRAEVRSRLWTRPAYRLGMDRYFKLLCAKEEIRRLNVEIPRVVTWIRDENRCLRGKEQELHEMEGKSAEQVGRDLQMAVQMFWCLAETPGFTGSLQPGIAVEWREAREVARAVAEERARAEAEVEMDVDEVVVRNTVRGDRWQSEEQDDEDGWEDEEVEERVRTNAPSTARDADDEGEGEEAREEEVSGLMYRISMLAVDGGGAGSGDEHFSVISFDGFPFWDGAPPAGGRAYLM
ncbi:hypothetical protein C8R43DRAFT_949615 [Mycena crocata]|nr:hypothetical protein C8R43DRAFT_949615 [Mycena crocata]